LCEADDDVQDEEHVLFRRKYVLFFSKAGLLFCTITTNSSFLSITYFTMNRRAVILFD